MSEFSRFATMVRSRTGLLLLLLFAAGLLVLPAAAMINPAAGYCSALGYRYTDTIAADGSMTGYCTLTGNQTVDALQFLQGNASPEMGYCKRQGLDVRTVHDPAVCGMLGSTCSVCVKADGSAQEVTRMMGMDFREKICTDKYCCDPATNKTCPIGTEIPEVTDRTFLIFAIIAILIILLLAGIAYYMMMKKKGSEPEKKTP